MRMCVCAFVYKGCVARLINAGFVTTAEKKRVKLVLRGLHDAGGTKPDDTAGGSDPSPAKGTVVSWWACDICAHFHRHGAFALCITPAVYSTAGKKGKKPVPDKQPVPEGKPAGACVICSMIAVTVCICMVLVFMRVFY